MTRLTTQDIKDIKDTSSNWDSYLRENAGVGFLEIASAVSGISVPTIRHAAENYKVSMVPVTSGLGTIDTFSESVAGILRTMGFNVNITEASDVNGIYEARISGSDIVMMADDNRFIALNLRNYHMGENNYSTANGFTELLNAKAGNLQRKKVLVIGYGNIGSKMAESLKKKGAIVTVYDKDPVKLKSARKNKFLTVNSKVWIKNFQLIADASSEGDWLSSDLLNEDLIYVTPGVPLSLTEDAKNKYEGKFFHDHLEIGTAVMISLAI